MHLLDQPLAGRQPGGLPRAAGWSAFSHAGTPCCDAPCLILRRDCEFRGDARRFRMPARARAMISPSLRANMCRLTGAISSVAPKNATRSDKRWFSFGGSGMCALRLTEPTSNPYVGFPTKTPPAAEARACTHDGRRVAQEALSKNLFETKTAHVVLQSSKRRRFQTNRWSHASCIAVLRRRCPLAVSHICWGQYQIAGKSDKSMLRVGLQLRRTVRKTKPNDSHWGKSTVKHGYNAG
jgi:hypothetical protein